MSTTQTPVTSAAKPSLVHRIESGIVDVAGKIKNDLEIAGQDALKVALFAQKNQAQIVALASLAGNKSANVETVAMNVLGVVTGAVKTAGDAAAANGLNVSLDSSVIAQVKALIAELEKL